MISLIKKHRLNVKGSSLVELIIVTILFAVFVPIAINIFVGGRKITGQSYIQHAAATTLQETADILEFLRNDGFAQLSEGSFFLIRNPGNNSWLIKSELPDKDLFERYVTISNTWRNADTNEMYFGEKPAMLNTLYLHDDEAYDLNDTEDIMNSVFPTVSQLVDYDGNGKPGLRIVKGYSLPNPDPETFQDFVLSEPYPDDVVINGDVTFELWMGMKNLKPNKLGVPVIQLLDEDINHVIATKSVSKSDWSDREFANLTFVMPNVNYNLAAGHRLVLRVYLDSSSEDTMWMAYGTTAYASSGLLTTSEGMDLYEDPRSKKIDIEILWAPDYTPGDMLKRTQGVTDWHSQSFRVNDWQSTITYIIE